MPDPEALFGRLDAAIVLAVEQANGGELSSLAQVIATFQRAFRMETEAEDLAESFGLLIDAKVLEYSYGEIGLAPKGRKLLRKAGAPWDNSRPGRLTTLLAEIEESDLVEEGTFAAPSPEDVRTAIGDVRTGAAIGMEFVDGDMLAPHGQSRFVPGLLLGGTGRVTLSGGTTMNVQSLTNPYEAAWRRDVPDEAGEGAGFDEFHDPDDPDDPDSSADPDDPDSSDDPDADPADQDDTGWG